MHSWGIIVLLGLIAVTCAQSGCKLDGGYICTGGQIEGMKFGRTLDSDYFRYYQTNGDNACTIVQQGNWDSHSSNSRIDIELDDDDDGCVISGDFPSQCSCRQTLQFTASNKCQTLTGPNGEVCTPSDSCDDEFSCPNGATPIARPGYTPGANGCGPESFPLAGPSFSFLECCNQHDYCYGTCGKTKSECDAEFYECTYCSCEEEYDNFLRQGICQELACTYFQAVDLFGCNAFAQGQEEACSCPGAKSVEPARSSKPVSKFGPVHPSMRQTEVVCSIPFISSCASRSESSDSPRSPQSPASPNSPNSPISPISPNSPNSPNSRSGGSPDSGAATLVVGALFLVALLI